MIKMTYTVNDFNNPQQMVDIRTRQIRVRIQNLQSSLVVAQHPFTKAVIEQELQKCVDEYVFRRLSEGNE